MWKAYYDTETMSTSNGFSGWETNDWAAVAQRRTMLICLKQARDLRRRRCEAFGRSSEACGKALHNYTYKERGELPACFMLRKDHAKAALRGVMDGATPPFPYSEP